MTNNVNIIIGKILENCQAQSVCQCVKTLNPRKLSISHTVELVKSHAVMMIIYTIPIHAKAERRFW